MSWKKAGNKPCTSTGVLKALCGLLRFVDNSALRLCAFNRLAGTLEAGDGHVSLLPSLAATGAQFEKEGRGE